MKKVNIKKSFDALSKHSIKNQNLSKIKGGNTITPPTQEW